MFDFLYEWIQNIAFYMILATAFIQVLPDHTYKKYIRFFTGMILILLLMTPVLRIFGMENQVSTLFDGAEYEKKIEEIERQTDYLNDTGIEDYVKEETEHGIEVEEIQIDGKD